MDIDVLLWFQALRESVGGALNGLAEVVRFLGEPALLLAVVCVLLWCVSREAGFRVAVAFSVAQLACQLLKIAACVYRPWIRDARVTPLASAVPTATGYSFPSGHTVNAASVCGGLAIESRKRKWLAAVLWALCILVGVSRLYVGVHTPQDVLVGLGLGIGALALTSGLPALLARKPKLDLPMMLLGVLASVAVIVYAFAKPYPTDVVDGKLLVDPADMRLDCLKTCGTCIGFWLGWFWERRAIRYTVEGSLLRRVARGAVGLALTLVLYIPFGKLLKLVSVEFGAIVTHLLVMLFVTGGYPWLFQRFERRMDAPATKAMG